MKNPNSQFLFRYPSTFVKTPLSYMCTIIFFTLLPLQSIPSVSVEVTSYLADIM